MAGNVVYDKSFDFAIHIVEYYKYIKAKENVLSHQLLRSGTSIGANVSEAIEAQSKNDFISKMSIALKEARESEYWIKLLMKTGYITKCELLNECVELLRILTSIVGTSKK